LQLDETIQELIEDIDEDEESDEEDDEPVELTAAQKIAQFRNRHKINTELHLGIETPQIGLIEAEDYLEKGVREKPYRSGGLGSPSYGDSRPLKPIRPGKNDMLLKFGVSNNSACRLGKDQKYSSSILDVDQ